MPTSERTGASAVVRYRPPPPALFDDPADRPLAGHLPANLLDDDFVTRFLKIFEDIYGTVTSHADGLEHLVDPSVAPPRMVEAWMRGLGFDAITRGRPDFSLRQQRTLLASTGLLIGQRGTLPGLRRFLGLVLGTDDTYAVTQVTDNGGVFAAGRCTRRPDESPHVTVTLPHTGGFHRAELIDLIRAELPADVVVSISVRTGEELEQIYNGFAIGPQRDLPKGEPNG